MVDENLKYIVAIQPGSAVERILRFTVKAGDLEKTVDQTIAAGIGRNLPRDQKRTAEAIKAEMGKQYNTTANGTAVAGNTPIGGYFTPQPVPQGQGTFMGVNLVVAAKQIGGQGYR